MTRSRGAVSGHDQTKGRGFFGVVPRWARILRLIDSCITQLKAQGPSRTCNESNHDRVLERVNSFKTVSGHGLHL